jgi:general secretion pathway protein A
MFVEYYGLREQPFGVTPDPRFLYLGEGHREALAALFYGIESGRGFSALAAEPGMGKTSLLMRLLETMQESARTAFLFQTEGGSREFLHALLRDLGIVPRGKDLAASHEALNETLLNELHAGRRVLVVIDEAQNLTEKTLESVRLLSNFETPEAKLMHIVLAGQPKLAQTLAKPSLTQLRQRVSNVIQLKTFRADETADYIKHRLRTAGLKGQLPFSPDALSLIARSSKGIPRNINNICFQALSLGFGTDTPVIGSDIVKEVLNDLEFEKAEPHPRRAASPVPSAPNVPPRWPYLPPLPESYQNGFPGAPPRRPSGVKFMGVLSVAGLAVLGFFLLSANRDARGAPDVTQLRDVLFGTGSGDSDQPPKLPSRLAPPPAPAIEKSPSAASEVASGPATSEVEAPDEVKSARDELASRAKPGDSPDAHVVRIRRAQTTFEIAREYLGRSNWKTVDQIRSLNPRIRGAYQILPPGTPVVLPGRGPASDNAKPSQRGEDASAHMNFTGTSTMVRVRREETLFQFAMDQYGKSGWELVRRIRALNPQLRDPYQVLREGQWIRVPQVAQE